MTPAYNFGIRLYGLAVRIASPVVPKARQWILGRRNWRAKLKSAIAQHPRWVWFHCASLGEFEQGRPVIEAWKKSFPGDAILLTFFSPSGYEVRKNYAQADHVAYLPLDTPRNATDFVAIVQPKSVFFVKYDLWLNFLGTFRQKSISHYLISALLRPDSRFLKNSSRKMYLPAFAGFERIFVQDAASKQLLERRIDSDRVVIAGDTRFDRVAQLPARFKPVPGIEDFLKGQRCIVVGSTHSPDEAVVLPVMEKMHGESVKWIIAPHEIDVAAIQRQVEGSAGKMGLYSRREELTGRENVLWIDNVGMLGRLYHYADLAYVGGGFGKGIHNTQEPASYGNPVLFGPRYQGFVEAVDMIEMETAAVVTTAETFEQKVREWLENDTHRAEMCNKNRDYIQSKAGATRIILAEFTAETSAGNE